MQHVPPPFPPPARPPAQSRYAPQAGEQFRRIWRADEAAFRDHLLRLDPQSRHDRFGFGVSDDFIARYAERCFGMDDVIHGFFVDGVLRGAGELRGLGHGLPLAFGGAAEAAFSVEKDWRGRGIGTELMERIVRAARNRRAGELYMSCLPHNTPMQRIARKFAAVLQHDVDQVDAAFKPLAASPASVWQEMVEDSASFAIAMVDLQKRTWLKDKPAE
ncbi:MAG: GNAT family N-acetyltransferase [Rhizobiales bacterium]|nr:GNAT family N-acetyltransferase [Hyphomicrobiales bacterium]